MKKISFILFVFLFAVSCKKDKKEISSNPHFYTFSGETDGIGSVSAMCNDGSVLVCGYSMNLQSIWKIAADGKLVWQKNYSGNMDFYGIVEAPDGNIYVCGKIYTDDTFRNDFMLMKFNASGGYEWTRVYSVEGNETAFNIINTNDGNLLLTGTGNGTGEGDLRLVKVKLDGDTLWTRDPEIIASQEGVHTLETADGGFLITGTEYYSFTASLGLYRFDSDGKLKWAKRHGEGHEGYSSVEMADGKIITCGSIPVNSSYQVLVQKSDAQGELIWTKDYGLEEIDEQAIGMKQNADGTMVMTGIQFDDNLEVGKAILMKIDGEGNTLFSLKFGETDFSVGLNVLKDKNDDNVIVGFTDEQIFTVRTDNQGRFK